MSGMNSIGGVLPRVVAFQERLARRTAQTVTPFRGGFAVLDDRYPVSYEHNQLFVTAPAAAPELLAETDRVLRRRRHRQITVLDDALGRRLAPRLQAAGYVQDHLVVMALQGRPGRPGSVPVERVPLEDLRQAVSRSWTDQDPDLPEDVVRQLFERRFATAAACQLSSHVVQANGGVVAWCHLYRLGDEAQVESVNTLPGWRRRGFARAVVMDAVAAAAEAASDLVFLLADREDWPWRFYERLGFAVIGEQHVFVRR